MNALLTVQYLDYARSRYASLHIIITYTQLIVSSAKGLFIIIIIVIIVNIHLLYTYWKWTKKNQQEQYNSNYCRSIRIERKKSHWLLLFILKLKKKICISYNEMHKVISQHEPGNVICHNSWQNKAIIWVLPFHIPILYNTLSNYFTYIVILFLPFFVSHNIFNKFHTQYNIFFTKCTFAWEYILLPVFIITIINIFTVVVAVFFYLFSYYIRAFRDTTLKWIK